MSKDLNNDTKDKKVIRNFGLSTWAINNKNTVYLFTVATIIFGILAYVALPKELFPDIKIPTVMVQTLYPGNPPVDMENLVTRPLEKQIESVKGIKKMTSISSQDASNVFIEFHTNVDIRKALSDVKDAVDKAKSDLPDDLPSDPLITDIDVSEFPVINVNLSGNFSLSELKNYANDLKDEFEAISQVSKVNITGITDREVKINLNPFKMAAMEVSYSDVENAVKSENLSISGGNAKIGNYERTIRVIGEFTDPKQIENIIVKHEKGNIVYLRDIGSVEFGFKERESYSRLGRQPVVTLQVVKKSGENLLATTDKVFQILKDARKTKLIPNNLRITITNDQSDQVKSQINNLENSIIMGILFVVAILFLFLGTRNSFIVGFSIPMSMLIAFMVMGIAQYKINMIVLFALILALGMLVDNAIVVTENIYRFVQRGYSIKEAARQGVGEVAVPIITSTATTLAAFFPLLFWSSIMGEFMKYLPITLIIVLTASLFNALVIVPVLFIDFYKPGEMQLPKKRKTLIIAAVLTVIGMFFYILHWNIMGSLMIFAAIITLMNLTFLTKLSIWFQNIFLVWLEETYLRFIRFALRKSNSYWLIFGTFVLMILTIIFYFSTKPKVDFFPASDPKLINVMAELPISTDIETTDSVMQVIENKVYQILEPDMNIVKSVLTVTGKGAVGQNEGFTSRGGSPNKGIITINFVDYEFRHGINTFTIMRTLSDSLIGKYPGVNISLEKQREGPPVGYPINIEVSGKDFNTLLAVTDTIRTVINNQNVPGIEGLKIDLNVGKPELLVHVDRDKARRFGLSTGQIGEAIRTALFGKEISDYKVGEDEYKIRMKLDDKYRYNVSDLMNQRITFRSASSGKIIQVPISAVASFEYGSTYGAITRIDRKRVITIYSNVIKGYNANEINGQLKTILKTVKMPAGYSYSFTGEQEQQTDAADFLAKALLIALALIMIILVGQFNSFVKPAIIMFSVLLSTIGVFGGLATFHMDFIVIMTGIGIVSLAGVVVNNAIVLIDYIGLVKLRRKKEMGIDEYDELPMEVARECIVEAGKTRLRPVLLTAITTVLGLMPLAIGLNINFVTLMSDFDPQIFFGGDNTAFWGPMSWTVIFGLSFATFLTLIIVPSMYHALYSAKVAFKKARAKYNPDLK
ncbi:MAG: efflux RND transporter permease subunit [Bacteroidales bacterium]|nr:efflux RND transporter permease subunit [Bacteroidales bacterium]